MENSMPKLRHKTIIFKTLGSWPEKLKTLTNSNYHRV